MHTQNTERFTVDGKECWLYRAGGTPQRLILLPGEEDTLAEIGAITAAAAALVEKGAAAPFLLAGFVCDDWNRDFSPWPAAALFKKADDFAGGGPATLAWLRTALLPQVAQRTTFVPTPENTALMGYSLAGLFALWATLESGAFAACAGCSASLWYEGWAQYAAAHTFAPGTRVYLSLGRSEEKAKNPRMAAVGDATRAFAQKLQTAPEVAATTLQWQEGGHFSDVPGRLSAALVWLLTA